MIDPSAKANRTLSVWNVQPVFPFNLNRDFHLISRIITPVIQRALTGNTDIIGAGGINPSLFLVRGSSILLQLGFGPTLVIPSATHVQLSSQRWSAGLALAFYTSGPLVAGILAFIICSFAGEEGRKINSMLIQPFNASFQAFWSVTRPDVVA